MIKKVRRAILSVSDKSGLVEFAKTLSALGVELISTGGTMKVLKEAGLDVQSISDVTGFPEIMDGRVKTLHPVVFSGILARRDYPEDLETLKHQNISPIDLIVVNLYPFEKVSAKDGATFEEVLENIDIGGPSMLRAAAKNFEDVAVLCRPDQYDGIAEELKRENGGISSPTLFKLAKAVFERTAAYDGAISGWINSVDQEGEDDSAGFPQIWNIKMNKVSDLRYGENPHQAAAYYVDPNSKETSIPRAKLLHGKPLSYNNIADLDTALECIREFDDTAAVILKHANPCGLAMGENLAEAYRKARECDPVSAFGGIVGLNREVDQETAEEIKSTFIECVIAPAFSDAAMDVLTKKKNIRLLETGPFTPKEKTPMFRSVTGGALVQSKDLGQVKTEDLKVVTEAKPTDEDTRGLLFAWKCVKWVKSNAIVYTTKDALVGVGAGQMSRVDAAQFGREKAQRSLEGTYLASDAFFPFRDGIDAAAEAGVRAVIEPGGSIRDEEVIKAADEHGIIMVFTGMRHFRH